MIPPTINVKIGDIKKIYVKTGTSKVLSGMVNSFVPFRIKINTKQPITVKSNNKLFKIFSGVKLVGQIDVDSLYYRKTQIDIFLQQKVSGVYDAIYKCFLLES